MSTIMIMDSQITGGFVASNLHFKHTSCPAAHKESKFIKNLVVLISDYNSVDYRQSAQTEASFITPLWLRTVYWPISMGFPPCLGIWHWPMITFAFQLTSKFVKLCDKTSNHLKWTEYFCNQQNFTATQKNISNDNKV